MSHKYEITPRTSWFGAMSLIALQFHAGFGRTQERLARIQESYITQATSSWLESLERSLAQMKEYQVEQTVQPAN